MRRELLFGTALATCLATQAIADPELMALAVSRTSPELITVTATRTEQQIAVTGASVTVLTAQDLKDRQTVLLTDALKEVPSLVVVRNGGLGQPASVSLRGAEAGQTVVLIDGVRVNDPSTTDDSAAAALGDLLVNNIDRVDVLRGPQSTLYGSDAIGGIVNVVTKRGGDTPFGVSASAEGGSFGTFHANVAANGSTAMVDYGAGLSYLTTVGTPSADVRAGNPENDGYNNFGATANVRVHFSDTISADLRGYYTRGHSEFDDGFGGPPLFAVADSAANSTNELKAGYLGLNADFLGGRFHNRIALIGTEAGRSFFDSASDITHLNYEYFSSTARFEYQGTFDLNDTTQFVFGAETQFTTFRNNNYGIFAFFSPPVIGGHDRLTGYYLQGQTTLLDRLTLTAGARLDDDDQFGTHTSYKLNAAYGLDIWDTTLRANVGSGFKAPSLFQQFGPNSNPIDTLKPESAAGWEAGFDTNAFDEPVRFSATYFDRKTTNQIGFQNCFTPADAPGCPTRVAVFGYYINTDKTHGSGVEIELKAPIGDTIEASLQYTNMTAANDLTHLDLPRRPHDLASVEVKWHPVEEALLGLSVTYQGKRFNDTGNFTPLTSNTTVNLFGSYDLNEQWQVFGRVDNLFNDRTEEVTGYGVPGIGAFAGIRAAL